MKKLLVLLFSLFFLSVNVNADIPRNSITNVKQLTWSEIIAAVSDTYQFGLINLEMNADGSDIFYPIDEKYGRLPENGVGQYLYRIHEFNEYSKYESLIDERWTVGEKNNQICYGETGDEIDDYGCFYVFEGFANGEKYLYFSETQNGDFYARVNRIVKTKNESSFDQWSAESEKFSKENILYVQKYLSEVNNASKVEYTYYENGQKKYAETYKDGKKNGKETWWYENGQKWLEGNYKDDRLDGKQTDWHENSQKWSEINYKDGKLDGDYIVWDQNEKVKIKRSYKNGQIRYEENYKDGKEDGKWTYWYENGQKHVEGNYTNGKGNGKWTEWNKHGKIVYEGNYKDGKEGRATRYWYFSSYADSPEDGKKKRKEENYFNGMTDGKQISWYENGQKEKEGNYKDGKKVGKFISWDKSGQIVWERNYKDGKCIGGDC